MAEELRKGSHCCTVAAKCRDDEGIRLVLTVTGRRRSLTRRWRLATSLAARPRSRRPAAETKLGSSWTGLSLLEKSRVAISIRV